MKPMNIEQLSKIATKNKTAEAVFTSWAVRERNTDEIDVARTRNLLLNEGFKVVPEELISTLKEMEKQGFGEFRAGKNGRPTRFRFNYSIKEMGKAALGEVVPKPIIKKPLTLVSQNEIYKTERAHHLTTMLSDGRKVTVNFLGKLSKSDMQLINDNIAEANLKE